MPIASMSAYMVVGPTNANPRRFSSFDSAVLRSETVGTSAKRTGSGVSSGRKDHTRSTRPSCSRSATVARALVTAARILRSLRMIRTSPMSRCTSASPIAATASGSKSWKTSRNTGRLASTVRHESPDWKPSSTIRSYSPTSSRTGMPHSWS